MKANRVEITKGIFQLNENEYGKGIDGTWYFYPPGAGIANLANHTVAEHEDGTITVSPSILITFADADGERCQWHGFLEKGIWRTI